MISTVVDWGSSSFRAYRFNASAKHIDFYNSSNGIKFIEGQRFETILLESIGHWLSPGDSILLSGMITGRNGWVETEYVSCPADLGTIAERCKRLTLLSHELIFLPGISQSSPPDVIRGEELQLAGAVTEHGSGLYVIPGTHSKWIMVEDNVLQQFRTIPTGELFDVITNYSLIGNLAKKGDLDIPCFTEGVKQGFSSKHIIGDLFSARASILLEQQTSTGTYSWLSGLLIGNEIKEGVRLFGESELYVIGNHGLNGLYLKALEHLGITATTVREGVMVSGFQKLIKGIS